MKRLFAVLCVAVLLAGCGGDKSDRASETTDTNDTAPLLTDVRLGFATNVNDTASPLVDIPEIKREGKWDWFDVNVFEDIDGVVHRDGIYAKKFSEVPFDGWVKQVLSEKIVVVGQFVSGKKQGVWQWWFESGQKQSESHWRDGMMTSRFVWFMNGQKQSEQYFKEGLPDGVWTYYNADGTINRRQLYKKGKSVKWEDIIITISSAGSGAVITNPNTNVKTVMNTSQVRDYCAKLFETYPTQMIELHYQAANDGDADRLRLLHQSTGGFFALYSEISKCLTKIGYKSTRETFSPIKKTLWKSFSK